MKLTRKQLQRLIESVLLREVVNGVRDYEKPGTDFYTKAQELIRDLKKAQEQFLLNDDIKFFLEAAINMQKNYEADPDYLKPEEEEESFFKSKRAQNIRKTQAALGNPFEKSYVLATQELKKRGIESNIDSIEAKQQKLKIEEQHTNIAREKYNKAFKALAALGDQTMIYGAEGATGGTVYDEETWNKVNTDKSSYSESLGIGWERKSQEVDEALGSIFKQFDEIKYDLLYHQVERKYELHDTLTRARNQKVYRDPEQVAKSNQAYKALAALEKFVSERLQ